MAVPKISEETSDAVQEGEAVEAPVPAPPPMMTAEDARRVLQEEAQQRLGECEEEVHAVLRKWGCAIATQLLWTEDGRATVRWRVQPVA